MTVYVSLLRGVNVGGNNLVKMDALRALYAKLGFRDVASYVQSGNVVFRAAESDAAKIARKIEKAIEETFSIRPDVVVRTTPELRDVVARNPFAARDGIDPSRLLVTFLLAEPSTEARAKALALQTPPEEFHVHDREMFTYCPNGLSKTKLNLAALDRACRGTGRNWNSVTKLLAMAEELER